MTDTPLRGDGGPSPHSTNERDRTPPDIERGPENHLALIYETYDEQMAALVPFVRQGLERGERVLYIVDENTREAVVDELASAGIDVETALESGALSFHSREDTYERAGRMDPDAMIDYLDETIQTAVEKDDYPRVRISAEMTWALDSDEDTLDALVEYESRLNQFLPDQPVIGLCQYNYAKFGADLLYDIIRAHPHQIYNATVQENRAYLPPHEFFGTDRASSEAEEFIETHLDRMRIQGELEHREENLAALAASSRNLLEGDEEEIVEQTVATVRQALDPAIVSVFRYDEGSDDLEPAVVSLADGESELSAVSLPEGYRERVWEAFVATETSVFSNFQSGSEVPELNAVIQSGIVLPVNQYGVLFIGSKQALDFDETDVKFASTVASSMEAALERTERERVLETQNTQLQRICRINRTIRSIDQALIRASTRAEAERSVCRRLTENDRYELGWVGSRDAFGDGVTIREWAGSGETFLDALVRGDAEAEDGATERNAHSLLPGPERRAFETGETQVVSNAATEAGVHEWRTAALQHGLQSCLSIPLRHDGAEYGVLTVYSEDSRAFTDMEREVLVELGSTIAFALDSIAMKTGADAERRTELTLTVPGENSLLCRFAREADCEFTIGTVVRQGGDRFHLLLSAPESCVSAVRSAIEDSVTTTSVRTISERDDDVLLEAIVSGSSIVRSITEANASVERIVVSPSELRATVELSRTRDPREFVEQLRETYPGLETRSIRRVDEPVRTQQSFYVAVQERLTAKQLQALRLAYLSGYFEWPRESTAQEVADSLDITQSTFSGHLRAAERKVFDELFDVTVS